MEHNRCWEKELLPKGKSQMEQGTRGHFILPEYSEEDSNSHKRSEVPFQGWHVWVAFIYWSIY
jgi:hypothetical protein